MSDTQLSRYRGMTIKAPKYDGSQNCASVGVEIMFKEEREGLPDIRDGRIVEVCNGCTFLEECREYAIKHERYGVYGGMTQKERERERRRRRIPLIDPYVWSMYGTQA